MQQNAATKAIATETKKKQNCYKEKGRVGGANAKMKHNRERRESINKSIYTRV